MDGTARDREEHRAMGVPSATLMVMKTRSERWHHMNSGMGYSEVASKAGFGCGFFGGTTGGCAMPATMVCAGGRSRCLGRVRASQPSERHVAVPDVDDTCTTIS